MEKIVKNCWECPFAMDNDVHGFDACTHPMGDAVNKSLTTWEELPKDKVHELCPLKIEQITIKL